MSHLRIPLILLLIFAFGCAVAARTRVNTGVQEGMNITTDIVDPVYELAVISCDAAEGIAIERHDEADAAEAEVLRIREECDKIFESIETVRTLQSALRATGDAYQAGTADFSALMGAFAEVKGLAAQVKALVTTFRSDHNLGEER